MFTYFKSFIGEIPVNLFEKNYSIIRLKRELVGDSPQP